MMRIKNYTGDGWGCVDYVMDENKNLLSYIIKIKSIKYIHEMGHIACGHYRHCNDDLDYYRRKQYRRIL